MKKIIRTLTLCSSALLMLTACEKESTNYGKAPDNIGPISLSRDRIGTGQPFVATCPLPTGGENIASVEYQWKNGSSGISLNGQQEGNQSTLSLTAPSTAGEYELIFTARYIFTATDKDGQAYKDISTSKTYTVEACDVLNSFWGDNVATTLLNRPSLQKIDDNHYGGQFPDQLSSSTLNPPLITTMYTFSSDKLTEISEMETYTSTSAINYFKKYNLLSHRIAQLLGVEPTRETVVWANEDTEPFNPEGDETYQTRIGEGILNHEVQIISVFHGAKTDMRLEVFTGNDGTSIEYMRTYQKAGTMQ